MESALQVEPNHESLPDDNVEAKIRVLLIDDDPAYRHLCQRYLSRAPLNDFVLTTVADPSSAIAICREQTFDCLLIDYSLPNLTGTQVFKTLDQTISDFTPPAIILTADGGEEAAASAIRAGAADFMPKRTISSESLSRSIRNAVEKWQLKKAADTRARDLRCANQKLQSKNDQIQRFYHGVSHEVKTPLTAAREFIAIVLDGLAGPVTEQQEEVLTHALESCDQITSHFDDLIEMTRLDANKIVMNKAVGSLEKVVARSLASITGAVEAKSIYFRKKIDSPLPLVYIDGNRVIQVLSNLLGNAVKFTEPNGTITLSISHDTADGFVEIAVSDTGCGIAPKDRPQVFDRLFQVDDSGDVLSGAGLGLGLSIAKEIVQLHGGSIWVDSVFGSGSTFTFRLPVARSIFEKMEKDS